ncbi:hypothetical protein [Streptomyces antimicrobicus]|uniref:Glycosyltransferase RgtA/B/C/D-like domain-containing protein n=1 Tax=Streptomyces antimicrobicus TaxID=2883108 RepID=A0ABS8B6Y6_9ACTN|nr:hypothetical protein [Streptomyces antimicrobicus]MCB5180379.1 hypothetical protein [Streptomyces antimicrobicus]
MGAPHPHRKHQEAAISRTASAGRTAPWRWLPPLLALALGLWRLDRGGSMWRDESVTLQVARRPLGDLVGLLGQVDAVHGLHYALTHALLPLGEALGLPAPVALRLPSVLATALAATGVAALGHRLAGPRAALAAGVAYAVLPPVQMYAQEGRSYALVAAAVVWATYALHRRRWVAYAVLLAVACWLHAFAVLAVLAHAVAGWRLRAWRRCAAAVVACALPLALVGAGQADRQLGWLGRPSWADWAAYALVAGLALLLARDADRDLVRLALPLVLLPPGLLLAVSLVRPLYVDRYVLYALAGLALLAGARARPPAPARPPARALRPAAALAAALALAGALVPWSLWLRTPDSRKDDALAVAAAVRDLARPGDAVLFMPARRREWLLSSPGVYDGLTDLALAATPTASRTLQGTELPSDRLRARLTEAPRVLALMDPADQPLDAFPREAVKRQTLAVFFDLCEVRAVHGARVALYARPGECPSGEIG